MAYQLDVDAFDSLGQVAAELIGDSGIIREATGRLDVYGNVRLTSDNGTVLETDYLRWNSKTNRIETEAFVKITRGNEWITGWGLDADEHLDSFRILRDVKGTLTSAEHLSEP